MIGEEVYFLSAKDEWQIGTVTGTRDTGRSYDILTGKGTSLRRNRSHLKPRSFDILIISQYFNFRTSTPSQSELTRNVISTSQHPSKVKYSYNNNYDSYISETLVPLKSTIKPKKQTRFAGDPVTSVKTLPVRRTRSHPPKWTINAGDPDSLILIELSQARADVNLNQDLRGNLSVMSPRESHHTEETLPTVPLGQFQAQRSDNTTTNNIAHFHTNTPYQSDIFSDHNNSNTINENIVTSRTSTSSQREIFSETGTGTSSSKDMTHSDGDMSEEATHQTGTESNQEEASNSSSHSRTTTSSQSEIFSSYNHQSDFSTNTPSQSEISDYDVNSESSSRESSRPSSPESGNFIVRTLYSPLPEMAIVHRSMYDAIHTVREQHGRAVTRGLLTQ